MEIELVLVLLEKQLLTYPIFCHVGKIYVNSIFTVLEHHTVYKSLIQAVIFSFNYFYYSVYFHIIASESDSLIPHLRKKKKTIHTDDI